MSPQLLLENKCLASGDEAIEWDYGNFGNLWAYLGNKKVIKLHSMPVGQICLAAMVLRNAHVPMNGCNTCEYFACPPPSFDVWIKYGPRYGPLPFDVRELINISNRVTLRYYFDRD